MLILSKQRLDLRTLQNNERPDSNNQTQNITAAERQNSCPRTGNRQPTPIMLKHAHGTANDQHALHQHEHTDRYHLGCIGYSLFSRKLGIGVKEHQAPKNQRVQATQQTDAAHEQLCYCCQREIAICSPPWRLPGGYDTRGRLIRIGLAHVRSECFREAREASAY